MTQSTIASLQTLLNYITDSRDGYKKAAETVEDIGFKRAFMARAAERGSMIQRLETAIQEAGGIPEEGGTVIGTIHRNIMSLTSMVQGDEKAAIDLIDDGEERLREKVAEVLEEGQIAPQDKMMLEAIQRELKADARIIDRMEEMAD
ncbi:MAG: PA2169 family four-helix-bundle protein [Pseudomonadota bacterium]